MHTNIKIVSTIICLILSMQGPVFSAELEIGSYGGTMVLSTSTDPKTFNPIVAQEVSSSFVLGFLFEGLTTQDPVSGEVLPALAQQWKSNFNGTEWTFQLRADVYWADGKPFTADDVVYTFNSLVYNPDIMTSLTSVLSIDGKPFVCKKLGMYSVQFTLPRPFAPFLRAVNIPILPKHKVEPLVIDHTFNESWSISEDPAQIIGTGPFQLEKYVPGERVVLKRNRYYRKRDAHGRALPYLERVVILVVPSEDVALLKFKNQELDMYNLRGIDVPWLKPFEKKGEFTLYEQGATMASSFIVCNQNAEVNPETKKPALAPYKRAWFSSKNFRQALAWSINRQDIIDIIFNGLAIPQHAALSPTSGYYYNANVQTYSYMIKKAGALLATDGLIDRDGDGVREDKDGNRLAWSLLCNAGSPQTLQLANMIRKDFSRIGCEVTLQPTDFNTMVNKLTYTFDWDVALIGLTGGTEPHFGANVWLSSGPLHMWYPRQKQPATEWEARIDALFSEGVVTIDEIERKKLYDEWQEIVAEQVPLIYTVLPLQYVAVQNRVKNCRPTPLGGVLHNIEEMFIKERAIER